MMGLLDKQISYTARGEDIVRHWDLLLNYVGLGVGQSEPPPPKKKPTNALYIRVPQVKPVLGSDLGHRGYRALNKVAAETRSERELNPPHLLSLPHMKDHIHPEEKVSSLEIGRGESLVENCLASVTGTHALSLRPPFGVSCTLERHQAKDACADPRIKGFPLFTVR